MGSMSLLFHHTTEIIAGIVFDNLIVVVWQSMQMISEDSGPVALLTESFCHHEKLEI